MTRPRVPHLGPRSAPTPARGPAQWMASEWGLALLALVLAVLVWMVVWGKIAGKTDEPLQVELELRTSEGFVAFHQPGKDGIAPLDLKGPRAEIEEAITKLGQPKRLIVNVPAVLDGDQTTYWIRDTSRINLPFPGRLVESIGETAVDVFRIREVQTHFLRPEVVNMPLGIGYAIELEPDSMPVSGPAGKIGRTIQPNPIDVADLFADHEGGPLPDPQTKPLGFGDWRDDPVEQRYRKGIELPAVNATIRFFFEGRRKIRHPIEFKLPRKGYVVTTADPAIEESGYYSGTFEGAEEDLNRLEKEVDSWWYVVTIPEEILPADDEKVTEDLKIEFAHKQAIHDLRVRFLEGATLLVVIEREK